MAIRLDNEVIHTLTTERIMQNAANFSQKSGGTIVPVTDYHQGRFLEDVFFKGIGDLNHRNPDVNTDITTDGLETATSREVKIFFNKAIEWKLTDIKQYGANNASVQAKVAEGIGDAITAYMLNKGIVGGVGAISSNATCVVGDTTKTMEFKQLLAGLKPFGDNANALKNWVMSSNEYFNLMENGLAVNSDTVIGGILYDATPATLNRQAFVTDSAGLMGIEAGINGTLALTEGGIVVRESEERELHVDIVTGKENLIVRVQLEGAITVGVKGYAYKSTAGENPDDATLGAGGNWQKVVTDDKATAGTLIKTKA